MKSERKEPRRGSTPPPSKRPLRLPFDDRKQDFIGWTYDHRIGLIVIVILYLILGAAFIVSKVTTKESTSSNVLYIDMDDLELLEEKKEKLLVEQSNQRWSNIRNLTSNENALADDRNTDVKELMEEAEKIQNEISNNQDNYNKALNSITLTNQDDNNKNGDDKEKKSEKHEGYVTVRYSLSNPTRHERRLVTPAYRCEERGEVVVAIVVNQNGEVISAKVAKSSGANAYMHEIAIESARRSRFDVNKSAPVKQAGTITYTFIAQ